MCKQSQMKNFWTARETNQIRTSQQGDLYSPRNDPDPEMIPNPEMIPKSTPKWSRPRNDPHFSSSRPRNDPQGIREW